MLIRGLAHPVAMNGMSLSDPETRSQPSGPPRLPFLPAPPPAAAAPATNTNPFGSFLQSFGAVPVSGASMHKLLAAGETVLLYPGGAREVSGGAYEGL